MKMVIRVTWFRTFWSFLDVDAGIRYWSVVTSSVVRFFENANGWLDDTRLMGARCCAGQIDVRLLEYSLLD
jgi:hypothetical protein